MDGTHALRGLLETLGATFMPFGPDGGAALVDTFGAYEAEYAAVRRSVGILHEPQRGILRVTGADRVDYLHRMMTQALQGRPGGVTVRSFQLNEKGRILADVMIHHGDLDTWLETDGMDTGPLAALLRGRIFGEDVQIEDISPRRVAISLHGPATAALLRACAGDAAGRLLDMPGTHHVLDIGDAKVTAYRHEPCGVLGARLLVPVQQAEAVYRRLLEEAGHRVDSGAREQDLASEAGREAAAQEAARRRGTLRGRPIGWLAFNTARVEAGTPLFHVDFGPDSLPAETGVMEQAVSLKKGCYLGQEIVARMHNLGHPKRLLVALRGEDDRLPAAGTPLRELAADGSVGEVVGGVTSSTLSPLLGAAAIALAVVKWGRHKADTRLAAGTEAGQAVLTVQPALSLLPR